ncbi:LptA/OstA family protein [Aestuariivirga sp.]|uniref:LptA/OstA family protein n=1 Tax=Aestuariivirga sp. TaxID=2650926 RepID=UPI003BADACCA
MTLRLAAAGAAALFLFTAGPLLAQTETTAPAKSDTKSDAKTGSKTDAKTDGKAAKAAKPPVPVDIVANEMEILDTEKKAVFRGAVDATKGTTNLKSDTLTVTYADVKQPDGTTKTDATDLDAKGNVKITTPKETITGDWAKYDPQTEKLVVGGKVKLVQGTTVLVGNELHSDLKTSRTQMTGGRVKGSFLPK